MLTICVCFDFARFLSPVSLLVCYYRTELNAEHERRMYAEAIVSRSEKRDMVMNDFPKPKDVTKHVGQATDLVLRWTEKAVKSAGGHSALPTTIQRILVETFRVCQEEVQRCMKERLSHYKKFVGNDEPVTLTSAGDMRLDTAYVMYEVLTHNYDKIVPSDERYISDLAYRVLERATDDAAGKKRAEILVSGDVQSPFDAVIGKYLITFVEVSQGMSRHASS